MGNQYSADLNDPAIKDCIIKENGTVLDLWYAMSDNDRALVTDEQLILFLQCPTIDPKIVVSIRLWGCSSLTDKSIIYIAQNFPNLTFIYLSHCSRVTGTAIKVIAKHCGQSIKILNAGHCNIHHLSKSFGVVFPNLKKLDLQENYISKIPASLGLLELDYYNIRNNPIQDPPIDIAEEGPFFIRQYFEGHGVDYKTLPSQIQDQNTKEEPRRRSSTPRLVRFQLPPSVIECEIFISHHSTSDRTIHRVKSLHQQLLRLGLKVYMVDPASKEEFSKATMQSLYHMKTMIAFCTSEYGVKTSSSYSSHYDLKYAHENEKHILPIRVSCCEEWPPAQLDVDGGYEGRMQNLSVFKPGMPCLDWFSRDWNAELCAKEVRDAFENEHLDL